MRELRDRSDHAATIGDAQVRAQTDIQEIGGHEAGDRNLGMIRRPIGDPAG